MRIDINRSFVAEACDSHLIRRRLFKERISEKPQTFYHIKKKKRTSKNKDPLYVFTYLAIFLQALPIQLHDFLHFMQSRDPLNAESSENSLLK